MQTLLIMETVTNGRIIPLHKLQGVQEQAGSVVCVVFRGQLRVVRAIPARSAKISSLSVLTRYLRAGRRRGAWAVMWVARGSTGDTG